MHDKFRRLASPEQRYPRHLDSVFWMLHFCPGYVYFIVGLGVPF